MSAVCQTPTAVDSPQTSCSVLRPGIKVPCPPGWNFLREGADITVITNVQPTAENHNQVAGPGMATIEVFSKPKNYEDLARWIWVGRKNVPDGKESKFTVVNERFGKIEVVSLMPAETSKAGFAGYFFQIGRTPVLVEANYLAQDPKSENYRAMARWMIERMTTAP